MWILAALVSEFAIFRTEFSKKFIFWQLLVTLTQSQFVPCPVDVLIILDNSGSIQEEFMREREFAEIVVNTVPDADFRENVRFGLITFAARGKLELPFGSRNTKQVKP